MAKCIFCSTPKCSKEHVWGRWWQKYYPVSTEEQQKRSGHQITISSDNGKKVPSKGIFSNAGHPLSNTTKVVCASCNNTWMSQIETEMETAFSKYFMEGGSLSKNDVNAMQKWMLLKLCLQMRAYQDVYYKQPHFPKKTAESIQNQIHQANEYLWQAIYQNRNKLYGFKFFISRCYAEQKYGNINYVPCLMLNVSKTDLEDISMINKNETCLFQTGSFMGVITNNEKLVSDLIKFNSDNPQQNPFVELVRGKPCYQISTSISGDNFENTVLSLLEEQSSNLGRLRRNYEEARKL